MKSNLWLWLIAAAISSPAQAQVAPGGVQDVYSSLRTAGGNTTETLLNALNNLSASYPGLLTLFEAICYVGGFSILAMSFVRLSKMQPHESKAGVIVSIFTAISLMAAPSMMSTLASTLFGSAECGASRFIDYMESCKAGDRSPYAPVLQFVQFYGFFAFIRGWFLINKASKPAAQDPDGTKVKGAMHVIFGVMCIHIKGTLGVLGATFGFGWVTQLIS